MDESAIITRSNIQPVIELVIDGLDSQHSKDAYGRAIRDFMVWWEGKQRPALVKATVQEYRSHLVDLGLSPATVNQRISAIRRLAGEAADNGMIPQDQANGIGKVKGIKSAGVRTGNWLTKAQAERLINTPDPDTVKGLRDRAILALMIGAGLRRSEVAALTFDHIQQREGRWVIVDLVGKRNRVRSVPIPSWAKDAIDQWSASAEISTGKVFRGAYRGGNLLLPGSEGITPQAAHDAVKDAGIHAYEATGDRAFLDIAPHDLRRTFAKLAHRGGAGLDQIQLTLGHASIKTTEKYLGVAQNLTDAPCDRLGLDLSGD